jgi:adenylate cyclase
MSEPRRISPRAWGFAATLLLVVFSFGDFAPQQGLRLLGFDLWSQIFPRERDSDPGVVVAIDEDSLARYGQWPWPRSLLTRLVERLGDAGAAAIGFDFILPEADRGSPQTLAQELTAVDPELARRVAALPDSDAQLGLALKDRHVVLAGVGVTNAGATVPLRSAPCSAACR